MEVIAGAYRGRKLLSPPLPVRPIPVLLRKSLFDILAQRIEGCTFLDACAGSGIVGIEALSRGAARVDFVEADRKVAALIERNLRSFGAPPGAHVHVTDLADFIRGNTSTYDFVFLDPPYGVEGRDVLALTALRDTRIAKGGFLVLKAPSRLVWPEELPAPVRVKTQGSNALYFFSP